MKFTKDSDTSSISVQGLNHIKQASFYKRLAKIR